jgi:hypothetical protein
MGQLDSKSHTKEPISWPQQPRSAVAPARAGVPARGPKTGHRRPPKWLAIHPAIRTPGPGNDALRRMERASMDQSVHNAEYELYVDGVFAR